MAAIPPFRRTGICRHRAQPGPLPVDTEFASFLAGRRQSANPAAADDYLRANRLTWRERLRFIAGTIAGFLP